MKRKDWEFPYLVKDILAGAEAKVVHHQSRLAWWEAQQAETEVKIKSGGIEIDKSLADTVSNSYARQPSVQIRDDLVRDMTECVRKVKEHRDHVQVYAGWVEVLRATQQSQSYPLHHEDWLFFFGVQG